METNVKVLSIYNLKLFYRSFHVKHHQPLPRAVWARSITFSIGRKEMHTNHRTMNTSSLSKMSRTAIVTPKICACTLVSMMVVLIVGDALQECV